MNVLMTTDTIGGVWTFTVDLIKALEPFHVHILLASMGRVPSANQVEEIKKFSYVEFHSSNYKLEWMEDPWSDLQAAQQWILKIAGDFDPDIIHFNSYSFNPDWFEAPVIVTGHSCVTSWWKAVKNETLPASWDRYFSLVKETVQAADIVVAPSRDMLGSLLQFYGPLPKTEVIYNAGNPDFFIPDQPKEPIIFAMGRIWDEAKNMRLLKDSSSLLDIPIYIAGDNSRDQHVNEQKVFFTGELSRKEIANWLAKSSIFVLPSLYEPFGLSALEAAYSGCALMLADIPSLREIWGEAATYFNPWKIEDFVDKINFIKDHEDRRQELAQRAHERSKLYLPGNMANKYYSLYINLKNMKEKKTSVLYY